MALLGLMALIPASGSSSVGVILGTGLLVLALLEQVNYTYYQLMYDRPSDLRYLVGHGRLRRASLRRDLDGYHLRQRA